MAPATIQRRIKKVPDAPHTKVTKLLGYIRSRVKRLNEAFTDGEFEQLKEHKGNRTWHDAILDEFGVRDGE